jgi:kumamolisin
VAAAHHVPLPGSQRQPVPGAFAVGIPDPEERLYVTVYVRSSAQDALLSSTPLIRPHRRSERLRRSAPQADSTDANPYDIARVQDFAYEYGLEVLETNLSRRSVLIAGTADALQTAFGVELRYYESTEEVYCGYLGSLSVPRELDGIVEAVLGLDDRCIGGHRPRFRKLSDLARLTIQPVNPLPFAAVDLHPPGVPSGPEPSLGMIAFSSTQEEGYGREMLRTYFEESLRLPMPKIEEILVHGPGTLADPEAASLPYDTVEETTLHILAASALVTGAKLAVYFTERTEQGWVDALFTAVTDTENAPSMLLIGDIRPEDDPQNTWTAMALAKIREAFTLAEARGITIYGVQG